MKSPAYYSQPNGQAERFVDSFKRALMKSDVEGPLSRLLLDTLTSYRPNVPDGKALVECIIDRLLQIEYMP